MDRTIDYDLLNSANELLDLFRMYRISAERGIDIGSYKPVADSDSIYEDKVCFLESFSDILFPSFQSHIVNSEDFAYAKHFGSTISYFDEDEYCVEGFLFDEAYLYKFYEMCIEKKIDIENTRLWSKLYDANACIHSYDDGASYMEIFIPNDEVIKDSKCPVMMFFTDSSLFNSGVLLEMLDAFDYCKKVVDGEIELEEA